MKEKSNSLYVYTFYRFINVLKKHRIKKELDHCFKNQNIKGTILISNEGINGSLSGTKENLDNAIKILKKLLCIRKLIVKINKNNFIPFNKLRIRIKKEIVSLGQGKINVNKLRGQLINPKYWNKVITEKNIRLIDVRNDFEIDIGSFRGAERAMTKSFREFPASIKKFNLEKNSKIAMYCTGGIRCEKASAFLKKKGYKNVVQLDGGILNYMKYIKVNSQNSLWTGECFVFDDRVTVKENLNRGNYVQCYGCRRPITKSETLSKFYKKGVSCQYCFKERTKKQKQNSEMRQTQIESFKINN